MNTRNALGEGTASPALLPQHKMGIQLYTVRNQLAEDLEGTLGKIADTGYRELEFAGYHGRKPDQLADVLQSLELRAPSAHVPLDALQSKLEDIIESAKVLGHQHLVLPWLNEDQRQSATQYEELARFLNIAGATCRSAGIELSYHNHDFEFFDIDGIRPYDLLLDQTETNLVKMELDLYWITKAGFSVQDYFQRHPGRFTQCHVKDMGKNGEITDVGRGVIDFAALIPAAQAAGVEHFYVEHDNSEDPLGSIERSYASMSGEAS